MHAVSHNTPHRARKPKEHVIAKLGMQDARYPIRLDLHGIC